jgi:hypothetical protein
VVHFFSWAFLVSSPLLSAEAYSGPMIDVNNAVAREYTAFPGWVGTVPAWRNLIRPFFCWIMHYFGHSLYPTIAAKLINAAKKKPFTNKGMVSFTQLWWENEQPALIYFN